MDMGFRIGLGTDYHQLAEGRKLILGGLHIPFTKGAVGHSDADVLLHAIIDALLGALALGDIGTHFPNNNDSYKNIDSKILLLKTYEIILKEGYELVNLDTMISLQEPKIAKYIPEIINIIAHILSCKNISIKVGTTENMGFVGRGEGIMAQAVVLIKKHKYEN